MPSHHRVKDQQRTHKPWNLKIRWFGRHAFSHKLDRERQLVVDDEKGGSELEHRLDVVSGDMDCESPPLDQASDNDGSTRQKHSLILRSNPSPSSLPQQNSTPGFQEFITQYPEYTLTSTIDDLRQAEFSRLKKCKETYVDYMGGSLYPESLVDKHGAFLRESLLGNTHSVNNSSQMTLRYANEARASVLSVFDAPADEYAVVFTPNASGALKLVGESFPFESNSSYVLSVDSHNSVNGIREFARSKGAQCSYIPSTRTGGFELEVAEYVLRRNAQTTSSNLFVLTAQSNISNFKAPLQIATFAADLGYSVVLDGAALAAASSFSFRDNQAVDAMVVSFYKMFGYPTGVGALIAKKSFLEKLRRPWFGGGTVDLVEVPGEYVKRSPVIHEQFEDGTINYTALPSITQGLRFFAGYLPFLPLRLSCLLRYLISGLLQLKHENGAPLVSVLSRQPDPARRIRKVGQQSDVGSIVSVLFLDPSGKVLPNTFVEHAASQAGISLRTGCVCNPGGAYAMLGIDNPKHEVCRVGLSSETPQPRGQYQLAFGPGETRRGSEARLGTEIGVVRISLGLVSNFEDVQSVIKFASTVGNKHQRKKMMEAWKAHVKSQSFGMHL